MILLVEVDDGSYIWVNRGASRGGLHLGCFGVCKLGWWLEFPLCFVSYCGPLSKGANPHHCWQWMHSLQCLLSWICPSNGSLQKLQGLWLEARALSVVGSGCWRTMNYNGGQYLVSHESYDLSRGLLQNDSPLSKSSHYSFPIQPERSLFWHSRSKNSSNSVVTQHCVKRARSSPMAKSLISKSITSTILEEEL